MKSYPNLTRPEAWLPYAVAAMFAVLLLLVLAALYGPELHAAIAPILENL